MVAWLRFRTTFVLIVMVAYLAVLASLPVQAAHAHNSNGVAATISSTRTVASAPESRLPGDEERLGDAEAEPRNTTVPTQEPDVLPESGAAASLWPIFIALFIVAGYLALDTYLRIQGYPK